MKRKFILIGMVAIMLIAILFTVALPAVSPGVDVGGAPAAVVALDSPIAVTGEALIGCNVIVEGEGIGAATNLSDAFPWGLWVGFDVVTGVGLAAGGFTIAGAVYVLHLKQFYPVLRPAILTAFLGYVLVVVFVLLRR